MWPQETPVQDYLGLRKKLHGRAMAERFVLIIQNKGNVEERTSATGANGFTPVLSFALMSADSKLRHLLLYYIVQNTVYLTNGAKY